MVRIAFARLHLGERMRRFARNGRRFEQDRIDLLARLVRDALGEDTLAVRTEAMQRWVGAVLVFQVEVFIQGSPIIDKILHRGHPVQSSAGTSLKLDFRALREILILVRRPRAGPDRKQHCS